MDINVTLPGGLRASSIAWAGLDWLIENNYIIGIDYNYRYNSDDVSNWFKDITQSMTNDSFKNSIIFTFQDIKLATEFKLRFLG